LSRFEQNVLMKYAILCFTITVLLAVSSCKRDKYYTCVCTAKDSSYVEHTIGRQREDIAYAQCKAFADSSTSCIMEVRK